MRKYILSNRLLVIPIGLLFIGRVSTAHNLVNEHYRSPIYRKLKPKKGVSLRDGIIKASLYEYTRLNIYSGGGGVGRGK